MNNNSVLEKFDVEDGIQSSVFDYISHYISCRPYTEYRHNINLKPVFSSLKTNITLVRGQELRLPMSGRWYLYYVDNKVLMDVKLPDQKKWVCLADRDGKEGFCTQHKMDIRVVVGSTSKCIPRGYVYVIKNPGEDNFIFAISREVMYKMCDKPLNTVMKAPEDIWLNIYYHHLESNFRVTHYSTDLTVDRNRFLRNTNIDQSLIFINGEIATSSIDTINPHDYAEVVVDDSIVGIYNLNISDPSKVEYRNKNNDRRILIHIPKDINPDNDILNHRVCDVIMATDNTTVGRYVNRANTDDQFHTLTHNDFSINESLVTVYSQKCEEDIKTIQVIIRNHKKAGLILDRDSKFIACLYRLSDEKITSNLFGHGLNLWSANELEETSPYRNIVDDCLDAEKKNNVKDWLACLGYATVADVSSRRVLHVLATPDLLHSFFVPLSPLYIGKNVTAHVYLNGILLDPDYVGCFVQEQFLHIKLDPTLIISDDFTNNQPVSLENYLIAQHYDKKPYFTVELFDATEYRAGLYDLEIYNSITFCVDQDIRIFRTTEFNDRNKLPDHYIFNRFRLNTAWCELHAGEYMKMVSSEDIEGTNLKKITLTNLIKNTDMHCKFLVVSAHAYNKLYGVELQLKEMNYDIFCSHLLTVNAKQWTTYREVNGQIILTEPSERIRVPYLNTDNQLLVYLNHRELTEGLDYRVYQAKTKTGCICGQFVISQNYDYLNVAGNTFEVYSVVEQPTLGTYGFITEGRPTFESYYSLFPNSGMLFTDGKAYDHEAAQVIGAYSTDLHNTIRKGASVKLRALAPRELSRIIQKYYVMQKEEKEELESVVHYMEENEYDLEAPAIIEKSHHIYSTFLQTIIELVLRKKIAYNTKWSDEEIKLALQKYESMKLYDIGLDDKNIEVTDPDTFIKPPVSGLDYRFVDVLPTYRLINNEPDLVVKDECPIIRVSKSDIESINGVYICMNPDLSFIRPGERYQHLPYTEGQYNDIMRRIWQNSTGAVIKHYNRYPGENHDMMWVMYDSDDVPRYQAYDPVGVESIWDLKWEKIDGSDLDIKMKIFDIETYTAGEFPARRLSYTTDVNDINFLEKVAKLYLKKDLVQDGVNIT